MLFFYGHLEIVKYWLEHDADVNAKDNNGQTALLFSSAYGHFEIVKYLVEHGADLNAKGGANNGTALMHTCIYGFFKVKILFKFKF